MRALFFLPTVLRSAPKRRTDAKQLRVLDLSMPVMNGIEAAPRLNKLLPGTPIILFTLRADAVRAMDTNALGISAVFSKNDPLEQFLSKAHELLG